jgi:site-specific DNA-methyltransferase (adenine-specific)
VRVETIGDATLYLGDCLEILPTLPQVSAVVTDPPYGVNLGNHGAALDGRKSHVLVKAGYESYEDTPENFAGTIVPAIKQAIALADRAAIFCVAPNCWLLPAPDQIGGVYVPAAQGRSKWGFKSFSPLLLYGSAPNLNLGAKATAWRSVAAGDVNGHPCPKPIYWMVNVVDLCAPKGGVVLDPFMGSGTTGVACAQLGRKFIGIEIEPKYFDIACERIDNAYRQQRMFA